MAKRHSSGYKQPSNAALNLGGANARMQPSNVESNIANSILQPLSSITTDRVEDPEQQPPPADEWTLFPKQKEPEQRPKVPPKQKEDQWQK